MEIPHCYIISQTDFLSFIFKSSRVDFRRERKRSNCYPVSWVISIPKYLIRYFFLNSCKYSYVDINFSRKLHRWISQPHLLSKFFKNNICIYLYYRLPSWFLIFTPEFHKITLRTYFHPNFPILLLFFYPIKQNFFFFFKYKFNVKIWK